MDQTTSQISSSAGIVYIFANEAMPGYIKVGITQNEDVTVRLRQLDNTSIPLPFECVYAARVPDCRRLERTLHFVFGEKRARLNREFFSADPDLVKAIIELVALADVTPGLNDQKLSTEQREAITTERQRQGYLTFEQLGIPLGAALTFSKDRQVTCTVASPRKVNFEGEEMSLSKAALIQIQRMGYQWRTVNGWAYWEYEGRTILAIGSDIPRSQAD
jgi:hypothetical protein